MTTARLASTHRLLEPLRFFWTSFKTGLSRGLTVSLFIVRGALGRDELIRRREPGQPPEREHEWRMPSGHPPGRFFNDLK